MVLEIIQVQTPSGFQILDIYFCISNNNSRSRNARVKYSINRLFISTKRTSLQFYIWSISNGSQNNSSTRSQRVSIPRHPFVISATITPDPCMLEWNTLLIDCSSLEANIFAIDIFDLFLMVLRIIQVQGRSGFPFFDIFLIYQLQYLEIYECLSETLY